MITTFTNRTGTDACPSVPTTRRPARPPRRAVAPGGCTAAPGPRTARRCPRHPAATSWSARRPRTGRSAACPDRRPSTTAASSTTTGSRPATLRATRSPAYRVPPSRRRRPRRRRRYRLRRRWTCSTRSSSTSSDGRWRLSPKTVSIFFFCRDTILEVRARACTTLPVDGRDGGTGASFPSTPEDSILSGSCRRPKTRVGRYSTFSHVPKTRETGAPRDPGPRRPLCIRFDPNFIVLVLAIQPRSTSEICVWPSSLCGPKECPTCFLVINVARVIPGTLPYSESLTN